MAILGGIRVVGGDNKSKSRCRSAQMAIWLFWEASGSSAVITKVRVGADRRKGLFWEVSGIVSAKNAFYLVGYYLCLVLFLCFQRT